MKVNSLVHRSRSQHISYPSLPCVVVHAVWARCAHQSKHLGGWDQYCRAEYIPVVPVKCVGCGEDRILGKIVGVAAAGLDVV